MFDDIIELGKATITTSAAGDQEKGYIFRTVYAQLKSVSQNEFYTAAQSGLKPAYRAVLADYYDYDGEDIVRYNGELYHILRTYRTETQFELTLEARTEGQNG